MTLEYPAISIGNTSSFMVGFLLSCYNFFLSPFHVHSNQVGQAKEIQQPVDLNAFTKVRRGRERIDLLLTTCVVVVELDMFCFFGGKPVLKRFYRFWLIMIRVFFGFCSIDGISNYLKKKTIKTRTM